MKYILILLLTITGCSTISTLMDKEDDINRKLNKEALESTKGLICNRVRADVLREWLKKDSDKIWHATFCGYDLVTIPLRGE